MTESVWLRPVTGLSGLLKSLPCVVGEDAKDRDRYQADDSANYADEGLNAVDFADDLGLLLLFCCVVVVEEELIFFVTSDLAPVSKEGQKRDHDDSPDDK